MRTNCTLVFIFLFFLTAHSLRGQAVTCPMAETAAGMQGWDRYPTYDAYLEFMDSIARERENQASLVEVGQSALGRKILAMRITGPGDTAMRAPVLVTAALHGDEATGFLASLRLIDSLSEASPLAGDRLLSRCVIYIIPLANPDGTYRSSGSTVAGAIRENASLVDLNRNFPSPETAGQYSPEPETMALMRFARSRRFAFSVSLHCGDEVVNYPWDSYLIQDKALPDLEWWQAISEDFVAEARKGNPGYLKTVTESGHVIGSQWYRIAGGMQDWMYEQMRCRETTIEISRAKTIDPGSFNEFWGLIRKALTGFLENAAVGFCGIVSDSSGQPIEDAMVVVSGYDEYCSSVITRANGAYFRPMLPGKRLEACALAPGYASQCMSLDTPEGGMEQLDFRLQAAGIDTPAREEAATPKASLRWAGGKIEAECSMPISEILIVSQEGRLIAAYRPMARNFEIMAHNFAPGIYVVSLQAAGIRKSLKTAIVK